MDNKILDMRHAIGLWMNYYSVVCSSHKVLHEASIRYPLVEYLERRGNVAGFLEDKHSLFVNRPIDFQWELDKKHYCLEAKYARTGYTDDKKELQRYFDDICRLYFSIENEDRDIALFLICGKAEDCSTCFIPTDSSILEIEDIPDNHVDAFVKRYNSFLLFQEGEDKELEMTCSIDKGRLERIWEKKHVREKRREHIDIRVRNYDSINELYNNFCEDYVTSLANKDEISTKLLGTHKLTIKFFPTKEKYKDNVVYLYEIVKGHKNSTEVINNVLNSIEHV